MQPIQQNATRSNAIAAGAATAIVAGVMIVQAVAGSIISFFGNLGYAAGSGSVFSSLNGYNPLVGMFQQFTLSVLPIAIGVFLAFWLVVPLAPSLRIGRVILRSVVAAAIASALSLVFAIFLAIGGAVTSAGPLFGNSFPAPDGMPLFYSIVGNVQSVFSTFLSSTPLVVLAGVLVWLWLAKRQAPDAA